VSQTLLNDAAASSSTASSPAPYQSAYGRSPARPGGKARPWYDLLVIGGGSAGHVAASAAALSGARVALAEMSVSGGDEAIAGGVASKALNHVARVAATSAAAGKLGIDVPAKPAIDTAAALKFVRDARATVGRREAARRARDEAEVDVFVGEARFTGPDTVDVDGVRLRFGRAIIATGARTVVPVVPGLEGIEYFTADSLFDLDALPRRLAVLGGEPVGCELAQSIARLGGQVTVIDAADDILAGEDPDAALAVRKSIEADGVRLLLRSTAVRVESDAGAKRLTVRGPGGEETLEIDAILIGGGRVANIEGLDLQLAGVKTNADGIEVDDYLRTSNRRVFACGDVCTKYRFAHFADATARMAVQNALLMPTRKMSKVVVPRVTFTQPEVAHIGMTPGDAERAGLFSETYRVGFDEVDRAVADDETAGFIKLTTERGGERILGATIVSADAGESIATLSAAMFHGIGLKGLAEVLFAYPTKSEAIKKIAEQYQRSRLTPGVKRVVSGWLMSRR
jgi:pyruvate/2-oxoglutarate dehydrogenase complex dihydrolipoamide dehydrogenase (E3) component